MATFLYRIGRFAYRHRLLVIAVWLLLLLGAGAAATQAKPFLIDFSLPGTETERARHLMEEKFPGQGDMELMANAQSGRAGPAGNHAGPARQHRPRR